MKYTEYFKHMKLRSDRAFIKEKWIIYTHKNPIKTEVQSDGRIRKWAFVEEIDRYLRIILLPDGETVHNAFFDRNFNKNSKR